MEEKTGVMGPIPDYSSSPPDTTDETTKMLISFETPVNSWILTRCSETFIVKTCGAILEIRDACQLGFGVASFDLRRLIKIARDDHNFQLKILDVKFVGREEEILTLVVLALVTTDNLSYLYEYYLSLSAGDLQPQIFKSKITYLEQPQFGIISKGCKSLLHTLVVSSDVHVHVYVVKVAPTQQLELIEPLVFTPPERAIVSDAYECLDSKGARTFLALGTISGSILIYSVSIIESKYSILNATLLHEISELSTYQINKLYISHGLLSSEIPGFITAVYSKNTSTMSNTWVVHSKIYKRNYKLAKTISGNENEYFIDARIRNDYSSYVIQYLTKNATEPNILVNTLVLDTSGNITKSFKSHIRYSEVEDFLPLPLGTGVMVLSDLNICRIVWPLQNSKGGEIPKVKFPNATHNIYRLRKRIKRSCSVLRRNNSSLLTFDLLCQEFKIPQFIQLYPPKNFDDMRYLLDSLNQCFNVSSDGQKLLIPYINHTFRYGCNIPEDSSNSSIDSLDKITAYAYWLLDNGKYTALLSFVLSIPYTIDSLLEDLMKKLLDRNMHRHVLEMSYVHRQLDKLLLSIPECMFIRTRYSIPLTFLFMKSVNNSDNLVKYFLRRTIELCFKDSIVNRSILSKLTLLTLSNAEEDYLEDICISMETPQTRVLPVFYYLIKGKFYKVHNVSNRLRRMGLLTESYTEENAVDVAFNSFNLTNSDDTSYSTNPYDLESANANFDRVTLSVKRALDVWNDCYSQKYQKTEDQSEFTNDTKFEFESSDESSEHLSELFLHSEKLLVPAKEIQPSHHSSVDSIPTNSLHIEENLRNRDPQFELNCIEFNVGTASNNVTFDNQQYQETQNPPEGQSTSYTFSFIKKLRHYLNKVGLNNNYRSEHKPGVNSSSSDLLDVNRSYEDSALHQDESITPVESPCNNEISSPKIPSLSPSVTTQRHNSPVFESGEELKLRTTNENSGINGSPITPSTEEYKQYEYGTISYNRESDSETKSEVAEQPRLDIKHVDDETELPTNTVIDSPILGNRSSDLDHMQSDIKQGFPTRKLERFSSFFGFMYKMLHPAGTTHHQSHGEQHESEYNMNNYNSNSQVNIIEPNSEISEVDYINNSIPDDHKNEENADLTSTTESSVDPVTMDTKSKKKRKRSFTNRRTRSTPRASKTEANIRIKKQRLQNFI